MKDNLINVRELADRLNVSPRQCWKLAASGRLPRPVRLARSVRWRTSDIDRFIEAGCEMNTSARQAEPDPKPRGA